MSVINLSSAPKINLIHNPLFEVWQRGTSFASVASATYTADRWVYYKNGTMVQTSGKDADVQNGTIGSSLYTQITTAQPSLGVGDFVIYTHHIEGSDFANIKGRNFVLSFWVKSPQSGVHCVSFRNNANDKSYVAEYTVNQVNTWEYKIIRVKHNDGGTWEIGTSSGMKVSFCQGSGSTYHTTPNTWQTGNYLATSNQVNTLGTIGNTFKISQVALHEGIDVVPFISMVRERAVELVLCQRFFELLGGVTDTAIGNGAVTPNDTTGDSVITFKVTKRVPPVITFGSANNYKFLTGASTRTGATIFAQVITEEKFRLRMGWAGAVTLGASGTFYAATAAGFIPVSADL